MERCSTHPPGLRCSLCSSEGEVILDEPKDIWQRTRLDAEWRLLSREEADLYRECFETYKPHETIPGQAATLAIQDVMEFRQLLKGLHREKESLTYSHGKSLIERCAEIAYVTETGQMGDYWGTWGPKK